MLLELLGLTPEQIAKGEKWDPHQGERTRDTGDKIGDKVMSILTGTNYASEVERLAKQNHVTNLQRLYGDEIEDVADVAGYSPFKDLSTLDGGQVEREILRRQNTRNARSSRKALTGETDADLDLTVTDPGSIKSGGTRYLKTENETKEAEERGRQDAETRRLEGREDDRLFMTMELNRLDRKDEREARRDQLALENRRLDMQEARSMRRDRQAAIQQMMAGLAQMGAAIAI